MYVQLSNRQEPDGLICRHPSLRRDARIRDHPLPQRGLFAQEISGRLGRAADRFAAAVAEALHDVALAQGFGEICAEAVRDGARRAGRQEGADPGRGDQRPGTSQPQSAGPAICDLTCK